MRIRIKFAKTEPMRYTGHLDLHRAWERTFRRAALPLTYSKGFNPRPRINLASALPLGITSQGEVLDAWMDSILPLTEVENRLIGVLPPGIRIFAIQEIDEMVPKLQVDLCATEYEITFLEPFPELKARCLELLESKSLPRERRGKQYDLRPLILELSPMEVDGSQKLFVRLTAMAGATGRPEEVVSTLGESPQGTRIHRLRLIFSSENQ